MFKNIYVNKKRTKKDYIIYTTIAISIIVIVFSMAFSIILLQKHTINMRAIRDREEHLQKMAELKYLEKERQRKEKEEKRARELEEDAKLQLISTAQKERGDFKYNTNVQEELDKIFYSDKKEVYLTFDDGPSKHTNKVLDVLKAADVKATFFILGTNIKGREAEVRRIYNEGHTIANHSFSHKYASMYKSPEATFKEYNKTEKELKKILGEDFNSNLFRFPGGSVGGEYEKQKKQSREYFKKQKVAFIDWNALTDDSVGAETNKKQLEVFNKTRKGKNALVVLQHDSYTSDKTAGTVKLIIEQLKKEKYVFKNFNDILVKEEIKKEVKEIKNNTTMQET